jgi:hypothetical protein
MLQPFMRQRCSFYRINLVLRRAESACDLHEMFDVDEYCTAALSRRTLYVTVSSTFHTMPIGARVRLSSYRKSRG